MTSKAGKARFERKCALTADTSEYRFSVVDPPELAFRAGQFVSVALNQDENPARRSYSIASRSNDRSGFALVVKRIPEGQGSSFFEQLRAGDEVDFTGPMGFFVLELQHQGDIVFGATGTGIAPVIPMLDELARSPERQRRIRLFWGLRRQEDLFYQAELAELGSRLAQFSWEPCLTQPPENFSGGRIGRITEPVLDTVGVLERPTFYLVGNGQMVKDLQALLVARGVDRKRFIRTEIFFSKTA